MRDGTIDLNYLNTNCTDIEILHIIVFNLVISKQLLIYISRIKDKLFYFIV